MGRPKGSKNKTKDTPTESTTAHILRAKAEAAEDTDTPPRNMRNTDDDIPTQGQLAQAIKALADSQPTKMVPYSKFKTRSPFNPTGNKRRKLSRRCFQNGAPMQINKLHDEEIALLNQVMPGKYIDGLVTIVQQQKGGNTDLHIQYNCGTNDQLMTNKDHWRNLKELLQQCVPGATSNAVA